MRFTKMIRKKDRNVLDWIHRYVVDFDDENDESGLSWESTHEDALKFLHSIPIKERVQKFGFYSTNGYFLRVEDFDDIAVCLKKGFISKNTCKIIYQWNSKIGNEKWNMDDVDRVLNPNVRTYRSRTQNFLYNTLQQLIDMEVMECINPEVKTGRLYRLTDKGERILNDI